MSSSLYTIGKESRDSITVLFSRLRRSSCSLYFYFSYILQAELAKCKKSKNIDKELFKQRSCTLSSIKNADTMESRLSFRKGPKQSKALGLFDLIVEEASVEVELPGGSFAIDGVALFVRHNGFEQIGLEL